MSEVTKLKVMIAVTDLMSDSLLETQDIWRLWAGEAPIDKGLAYWKRREAAIIASRRVRARISRRWAAVRDMPFRVWRAVAVGWLILRGDDYAAADRARR